MAFICLFSGLLPLFVLAHFVHHLVAALPIPPSPFTRDRIREGLECLAKENARNKQEGDTEYSQVTQNISQIEAELDRFYEAIRKGVEAEALAKPINDLLDKEKLLKKQLAEIEKERERAEASTRDQGHS